MKQENTNSQNSDHFGAILFNAAYEGLQSMGASIPLTILPYLEKNGSVGPGSIVCDVKRFDEGLKEIFGFGAKLIEKRILEILYTKLKINNKIEDDFTFPEKIKNVQKQVKSIKLEILPVETVDAE